MTVKQVLTLSESISLKFIKNPQFIETYILLGFHWIKHSLCPASVSRRAIKFPVNVTAPPGPFVIVFV